jgi:hypothetical protein
MLLSTEPDLPFIKAPMAFPVFGRGRVLYALVGKGIKKKLIEETCNSVIGWCSCTIKEDNPGADLLFAADWEKIVGDSSWIEEVVLPEITGMSGFIQEEKVKEGSEITTKEKQVDIKKIEVNKKEEKAIEVEIQQEQPVQTPAEEIESAELENPISDKIIQAKTEGMGPLTRNIIIVILFLLIAMPTISFYLRKKRSNN